jgi:hypothetical protein
MDKNGQPRFVGKQNHPRVVTEPIGCLWYVDNSDTQFMLINATSLKTWISFDRSVEKYTKFANNLVAAGCGGLEHHNEKIRPWARGLCVTRLKTIGRGRGGHPWWAQPLFVMIK